MNTWKRKLPYMSVRIGSVAATEYILTAAALVFDIASRLNVLSANHP